MGQWATRTRRGGGISLNFIAEATVADPTHLNLRYLNDVDATIFAVTDFETNFSDNPDTIAQVTPATITLFYSGGLIGVTLIHYIGNHPGILNNQTKTF